MSDAPASASLFERAQAVTPGGVNSPVRAFRAVGGTPRFMVRGRGPYLYGAEGRGGDAGVQGRGKGPVPYRPRRPRVRRPRLLVGPDDPRAPARAGRRGGA